jgi:short-subunit dehydrogenase
MVIKGKNIVITGAASGIGRTLLQELLKIEDVSIVAADKEQIQIDSNNGRLLTFECDVSNLNSLDSLFDFAQKSIGKIDIFFANAGFAYYEKITKPDYQHIEEIYKVNVFEPLYICEKMYELNKDRDYKVVITSSAMGMLSLPGYALYSSTKAAINSFADAYRYELEKPERICIVCPISTKTSFFKAANQKAPVPVPFPAQTPEQVVSKIIKGVLSDKKTVLPSKIFVLLILFDRIIPFLTKIYAAAMNKSFKKWLNKYKT